jgi:predicted nucleic acid-binding protein
LPEVICDTSVLFYLHQLQLLHLLPALSGKVIVPPAVLAELAAARELNLDIPELEKMAWVVIRKPASVAALPLVTDLGPGESEVLALALESPDAVVIIDDALARRLAKTLGIRITGTLGVLLSAKRSGLIPLVAPILDALQRLQFRLSPATREAVLKIAGESPRTA